MIFNNIEVGHYKVMKSLLKEANAIALGKVECQPVCHRLQLVLSCTEKEPTNSKKCKSMSY